MAKANFAKGLSYLIAAQFQAVALIGIAWWGGTWLNETYPQNFNWFIPTFIVAILGVFQTFYVVVRQLIRNDDKPG